MKKSCTPFKIAKSLHASIQKIFVIIKIKPINKKHIDARLKNLKIKLYWPLESVMCIGKDFRMYSR